MAARVDLTSKISIEDFKKQFGKFFTSEAKLNKAYETATAKFKVEKPEVSVKKAEPSKA